MMKKNTVVVLGVFIKIVMTFKIDRFLLCDTDELSLIPGSQTGGPYDETMGRTVYKGFERDREDIMMCYDAGTVDIVLVRRQARHDAESVGWYLRICDL